VTIFIKNKLLCDGRIIGYTACTDGKEDRYSVHDTVKMVYSATDSNVFIVRNKESRLRMNDNDLKARFRHSHLKAKSGKMPIVVITANEVQTIIFLSFS